MQENHLFEYAVIRVVPRVEREEFFNAGVILFCKQQQFLKTLIQVNEDRLKIIDDKTDVGELNEHLCAFQKICDGNPDAGPIALLDISLRFRWLTAARSTVVQTSKVHPGLCKDAGETLKKLFNQLVL